MADDYEDFKDEHALGSSQMIEAAERGYRLDPVRCLPDGSFPPAIVETLLKTAEGFNPEVVFPQGSFPRPWPFVGGQLSPPPPPPPSRRLALRKIGEKWKIVWRGEIPTVRIPRRDTRLQRRLVPRHPVPNCETQIARSDPGRDPPVMKG